MASALRMMGSSRSHGGCSVLGKEAKNMRGRRCSPSVVTSRLREQYRTLRIEPGASEKEVKKAFRQLALQYHPDVCKGGNCVVQFHRINEAYDVVMSSLRGAEEEAVISTTHYCREEEDEGEMRGMCDSTWDLWEEWMGFEGACTMDFSSHINPYI